MDEYAIPILIAAATINIWQIKVLTCLLPPPGEGSRSGDEKNE